MDWTGIISGGLAGGAEQVVNSANLQQQTDARDLLQQHESDLQLHRATALSDYAANKTRETAQMERDRIGKYYANGQSGFDAADAANASGDLATGKAIADQESAGQKSLTIGGMLVNRKGEVLADNNVDAEIKRKQQLADAASAAAVAKGKPKALTQAQFDQLSDNAVKAATPLFRSSADPITGKDVEDKIFNRGLTALTQAGISDFMQTHGETEHYDKAAIANDAYKHMATMADRAQASADSHVGALFKDGDTLDPKTTAALQAKFGANVPLDKAGLTTFTRNKQLEQDASQFGRTAAPAAPTAAAPAGIIGPAPAATGAEPGNINLNNRPVVKNADGSFSTVRTIGVNIGGKEVVIPTVSEDGRIMTNAEAVAQFKQTGKHFGKFNSVDEANAFAQQLHNDQAQQYGAQGAATTAPAAAPSQPIVMPNRNSPEARAARMARNVDPAVRAQNAQMAFKADASTLSPIDLVRKYPDAESRSDLTPQQIMQLRTAESQLR
jgi:hypothetical protein